MNSKVEMNFEYTTTSNTYAFGFHSYGGYSTMFGFSKRSSQSSFLAGYGHVGEKSSTVTFENTLANKITFETSSEDYRNVTASVYKDDDLISTISDDLRFPAPNDFNAYLFAANSIYWGSIQYGQVKIKSCKIYDSDKTTLIRDYVPCFNEYNIFGLYDLVGNEFYTNKGRGIFNYNVSTRSLGGDGSTNNPYQIKSSEDLACVSHISLADNNYGNGKYFELTNDIVLNDGYFEEDGTYHDGGDGKLFEWVPIKWNRPKMFNGNGHSIYGLYKYCLFGANCHYGTYKNFNVKKAYIDSSNAIVFGDHIVSVSKISGIVCDGYVNSSITSTAGIVGSISSGSISNCKNYAKISNKKDTIAGIVGTIWSANIYDCKNYGSVSGNDNYVAGIVANCAGECLIDNCVNEANVDGKNYVSGILGRTTGDFQIITDSKNLGDITGSTSVGGILAYLSNAKFEIEHCENYGIVKGSTYVGGIIGYQLRGSSLINYCTNYGYLSNANYIGGILGMLNTQSSSASINYCVNKGEIKGQFGASGIATITNKAELNLKSCVNYGKVRGTLASGGIICSFGSSVMVASCFNLGDLPNAENGSEIVYKSSGSTSIINCISKSVVGNTLRKIYYGTDFSAFFVTHKTGVIDLKALDGKGIYFTTISEEYLYRVGYRPVDHEYSL